VNFIQRCYWKLQLLLAKNDAEDAERRFKESIHNASHGDPLASGESLAYLRSWLGKRNYDPHRLWGTDQDGNPNRPTQAEVDIILIWFKSLYKIGAIEYNLVRRKRVMNEVLTPEPITNPEVA
jgi:hypothetical protein